MKAAVVALVVVGVAAALALWLRLRHWRGKAREERALRTEGRVEDIREEAQEREESRSGDEALAQWRENFGDD